MSIVLLAGVGLGGLVVGGICGVVLGSRTSSGGESPAPSKDQVNLDLRYTCHPEQFFSRLERDLKALDPTQEVDLVIAVQLLNGWKDNKCRYLEFGHIYGQVQDVAEAARALLMDDNSSLIDRNTTSYRQAKFKEITAWAKRTDATICWEDSDSPAVFRVSGTVRLLSPSLPKEDPAKEKAEEEVEDLVRRHQAVLHARRQEPA